MIFLFGVMTLPACGPEPSDDPTVPDGGSPDNFASSCKKLYTQQYACYGESLSPEYADYIGEYCAQYAREIESEYGRDCVGALEEMYACMASLDCDVLLGEDGFKLAADCRDVALDAHEICPEIIGFCGDGVGAGGGSDDGESCELEAFDCLDGHEYGISCVSPPAEDGETPGPLSCTCQRDGMDVMSVDLADPCWSDGFHEAAVSACDFPDGVFR